MHQRFSVLWLVIVTLLLAIASPCRAESRPNVLLIVTDDQGWWDLGIHGNPVLETPVMDALASQGVELTRFYAAPVCAPTRAGLMTGRYCFRTGLYNTRFGGDSLPEGEVTLAEQLQGAGYRTGCFGKWHLGTQPSSHPNNQGFEEFFGFLHGHAERYDYPDQLLQNRKSVEARGYITELLTDAAVDFMQRHRDEPFFCYVPYNVPHSPFIVGAAHAQDEEGEGLIAKYLKRGVPLREARIYAMIERCDKNIGRLMSALDDLELRENTIVLFMSDNGGIHQHYNAGLRGRKASVYEGGVRVPLLARWPGRFPAGKKVEAMTSHIDLLPTLCELLDVQTPSDRTIDGRSLAALLKTGQGESPHDYVYHSWNRYVPRADQRWAVSSPRWKLADGRLFDLENDPGEKVDLSQQHPDLVRKLRGEFVRWFEEVTEGQNYEPATIEVGAPEQPEAELQASWAKLKGRNTNYTFRGYDWDTIDGWNMPGDQAQWKLNVLTPGEYRVIVSYGAAHSSAGSRFALLAGNEKVETTVEPTATPDVFIRRQIGTLNLPKGPATLKCAAVNVQGDELLRLNRIWLKPAGEPTKTE